jgi:hypothetical protein
LQIRAQAHFSAVLLLHGPFLEAVARYAALSRARDCDWFARAGRRPAAFAGRALGRSLCFGLVLLDQTAHGLGIFFFR